MRVKVVKFSYILDPAKYCSEIEHYITFSDEDVDCLFRSFVTIKSSNEIVPRRHRAVLSGRELQWPSTR